MIAPDGDPDRGQGHLDHVTARCLRCGAAATVAAAGSGERPIVPALCRRCARAAPGPHPRWTDRRWFADVAIAAAAHGRRGRDTGTATA